MIEKGDEVQRVLENSSISLCLDTGHLLIGGTDPAVLTRQAPDRIAHTHLKDVGAALAKRVQAGELTYTEAVRDGDVARDRCLSRELVGSGQTRAFVPEDGRLCHCLPATPVRAVRVVAAAAGAFGFLVVVESVAAAAGFDLAAAAVAAAAGLAAARRGAEEVADTAFAGARRAAGLAVGLWVGVGVVFAGV
jgi:hypothetical protein